MSELKTKPTGASVEAFLAGVSNEHRQRDARVVLETMTRITGFEPAMWGSSIVGFGSYQYKNVSGRKGEFFLTGLSPRKQALTIYIMPGFDRYPRLMERLGKHKTGRSCLYVNKLDDIDLETLEELIAQSVDFMRERYDV